MIKNISSLQNPTIKEILQLQEKGRTRSKLGLFVIEGKREIELAILGNFELETIFIKEDLFDENDIIEFQKSAEVISVSKEVYQKIAYRESTEGIIAIAKMRDLSVNNLSLPENPLILIAEAPEKPGNIGAMIRTADAANIDAIIIADPKGDLYNPNIIRSSVGAFFTTKIAVGSSEEIITFLKNNSINIFAATLQNANNYCDEDYSKSSAFVVGTEDAGLSEIWRKAATQNIVIPMQGKIDSMNVSVAAAILLFEAKRQRGFK